MSLGTAATPQVSSPVGTIPSNGNGPIKAAGPATSGSDPITDVSKQVQEVLSSEIGVSTLLNQLKASIASTKEFGLFLKKRSAMEETHAHALKKLSRMSQETMHQPDHKHGSFAQAYGEMMYIHERMAENGMQFAMSLHQMHDDLLELAAVAERSRKGWKTNGLAAEQRVAEIEAAMRKSKAKYDSLAEEYDRARTGDTRQSGKMFSLKTKSAAQQEEDLLRKVQAADQEYHAKVQALQTERAELVARTRPEAVKALQDLVKETDSGLALQMQKYASFNEKLLLSNGLSISPIKGTPDNAVNQPRSLRDTILAINNEKDLNEYIAAHHRNLPPNHGEIKYERNPILETRPPVMNPHNNMSMPHVPQTGPQGPQQLGPPSRAGTFQHSTTPSQGGQMGQGFAPGSMPPPSMPAAQQQRPSSQQHNRSFSQSTMLSHNQLPQSHQPARNSALPASRFNSGPQAPQGSLQPEPGRSSQGPPQLGALPFQHSQPQGQSSPPQSSQLQSQFQPSQQRQQGTGPSPLQQHPPHAQMASGAQKASSPPGHASPQPGPPATNPVRPVFGLNLSRLYERDGLAVPMVVYQCIQAVDLFGLGVEGIYRQSGSMNHINKLKNMFDTDSSNPALDFRNPESFYHDVNSVTGLLKQFFRDLPDPLLTMEHHQGLIEAAKHEDDILRRDSLHAIINSLPDPNYATLRALTLHLYRVMDNSHINRMNSHNLAVIFGPTLMGTDPSTSIADAGWQIKVVDTILQNTYQIFDED